MARLPAAGKSIAVILALILAAAATFAIYTYVQGIEDRAFEEAELVEVYVADQQIAAGTGGEQASESGLIVRDNVPRTAVPDGAIGALEQIEGLVALERVLPGEIIVAERFGQPDEVAGVDFEIPEGHEAISVQVGLVPGVSGFITAGDQISMIASLVVPIDVDEEDDEVVDEDGQPVDAGEVVNTENVSRYLLQNVEVLAVGPRQPAPTEGETAEGEPVGSNVTLTVALEPEDAERLVFAINNADLYFTLLPEDAEPVETPGRTLEDLFN